MRMDSPTGIVQNMWTTDVLESRIPMSVGIYVNELDPIPNYYGIAWIDWPSMRVYCLPIPLNILAGGFRKMQMALRPGFSQRLEASAYSRGRADAERDMHYRVDA